MKPTFYLVRPKAVTSTIAVRIYGKSFTGGKFVWSTGLAIAPELWDASTQRPTRDAAVLRRAAKSTPYLRNELKALAGRLDEIRAAAISHGQRCELDGVPVTTEPLRAYLDKAIKSIEPKPERVTLEIDNYIDRYLADLESGTRRYRGRAYGKETVRVYRTFVRRWHWFRQATGAGATWESVNMDLYHQLTDYLTNVRGLTVNSTGRVFKNLKAIMRAAYEEGHHANDVFRYQNFRTVRAKAHTIALTEDEVTTLYRLPLDAPGLAKARDLFVLGCYTAQRFSDYSSINDVQHLREIDGAHFYRLRQRKTKKTVWVPRHPVAAEILTRYGGKAPSLCEQLTNRRIKEIARLAGISKPTATTDGTHGAKLYRPRCELITTHTARRTGATMLHAAGLSLAEIMGITGHSSEGQLRIYLKIDAVQLAQSTARNPFFTDKRGAV